MRTEPLGSHHDRAAFHCGLSQLDEYFVRQASQDVKRRVAAVFVLADENDPRRVIGYYTLSSFAVRPCGLPAELVKKLPRYPTVPATLIGRLARDVSYPGTGHLLLADALKRILASSGEVASALVVVDAKDDQAAGFYRKFGFLPFHQEARKLWLPMATVAAAVG